MNMQIIRNQLISVICLCAAGISLSAQASASNGYDRDDRNNKYDRYNYSEHFKPRSPHHQRHHPRYSHVYYPSYSAYYSPHSRTWFWLDGTRWRSGIRLPFHINLQVGGIPIQLSSAIPYYEHRYVERHYPRPIYIERDRHHHRRHDKHYRPW